MAVSEEYVAAVLSSLDGWNRDDFDACVAMAHPDLEWTSEVAQQLEGQELVYRGLDEFRRYWDEWHAIWEVRIEVLEITAVGEKVFVLGCTDARGGASGVSLKQPIAYVYEFEDGMARRVRSYIDPDRARAAVGMPPAAA
jgi:ketosteroid isomerase-like protein